MSRLSVQVLVILAFAFTLFFVWDFSQRALMSARLVQRERELEQAVARARTRQAELIERKKYVQSPEYVEDYVRRHWHWVRDGDTIVLPQGTPAPPPVVSAPTPLPSPPPPEPTWWQIVLDLLFGP